jgi:transcriptional regulator with XRE-family HTH domain
MIEPQITEAIQKRRKLLKITQRDLAEISGVSLRTVKALETGDANPTLEILARVLDPLGLKIITAERVTNE